jgi:hypothetical protein
MDYDSSQHKEHKRAEINCVRSVGGLDVQGRLTMNPVERNGLMQTLVDAQSRLDYLASALEGCDEEFIALLRSAGENIKSAIEQLASKKT